MVILVIKRCKVIGLLELNINYAMILVINSMTMIFLRICSLMSLQFIHRFSQNRIIYISLCDSDSVSINHMYAILVSWCMLLSTAARSMLLLSTMQDDSHVVC